MPDGVRWVGGARVRSAILHTQSEMFQRLRRGFCLLSAWWKRTPFLSVFHLLTPPLAGLCNLVRPMCDGQLKCDLTNANASTAGVCREDAPCPACGAGFECYRPPGRALPWCRKIANCSGKCKRNEVCGEDFNNLVHFIGETKYEYDYMPYLAKYVGPRRGSLFFSAALRMCHQQGRGSEQGPEVTQSRRRRS